MVSVPSFGAEDVYAGHPLGLGFWPFFGAMRVAILLLVVGVTPTGNREAGKFAADATPIADGLPTRKPSETSSSPLDKPQRVYRRPREKAPLRARAGLKV
jgi:hypothetical protein